jgi:multidrug efflux pump subunit AcrA (membrane-fusion protein)
VDNQVNPRTGTLRLRGVFRNKDPAELLRSPAVIIAAGGPGTSIQPGSYTLLASVSGGAPVAAMAGQDSPVAEVLSPGYFARVRVPIGFPHKALLISDRAIDTDQAQKIVYVVNKENKVVTRPIRLGARQNGLRVIEEGLTRDDLVIVTGLQHIRPGVLVEPQRVEMPGKGTGD